MNLKKILNTNLVALDIEADSKEGIISELVDLLVQAGSLGGKSRDEALSSVLKREAQMSTGIQEGVAIPHGKSSRVKELMVCIAISKSDKDFGALDGKPSRIFVLTLSPAGRTGPHIQFLAEMSRLLTKKDVREALLRTDSVEKVIEIFTQ